MLAEQGYEDESKRFADVKSFDAQNVDSDFKFVQEGKEDNRVSFVCSLPIFNVISDF